MSRTPKLPPALACAAGLLAAGAPAFAAGPASPLTILSQRQAAGERSVTAAIEVQDLDLTTGAGRGELRRRVRYAADELCHGLGDENRAAGLAFVCEDEAVQSAIASESAAIRQAAARSAVRGDAAAPPSASGGGQ
jgi:UrcA family protein